MKGESELCHEEDFFFHYACSRLSVGMGRSTTGNLTAQVVQNLPQGEYNFRVETCRRYQCGKQDLQVVQQGMVSHYRRRYHELRRTTEQYGYL
jgi:hypothetical protein